MEPGIIHLVSREELLDATVNDHIGGLRRVHATSTQTQITIEKSDATKELGGNTQSQEEYAGTGEPIPPSGWRIAKHPPARRRARKLTLRDMLDSSDPQTSNRAGASRLGVAINYPICPRPAYTVRRIYAKKEHNARHTEAYIAHVYGGIPGKPCCVIRRFHSVVYRESRHIMMRLIDS